MSPTSSTQGSGPNATTHHWSFYLDTIDIYLEVENELYKVPRYLLVRESVFFKDMFSLPKAQESSAEGLSREYPIHLPGTTKAEMAALMECIHWCMRDESTLDLPPEFWVNLLSISSRLLFDCFRTHAIKELTSLSSRFNPVERVHLALQHDIDAWLEPAYRSIVLDKTPLSFADAGKLPWEIAALLFRSREIFHSQKAPSSSGVAPIAGHGFTTTSTPPFHLSITSGGGSCFGLPEDQLRKEVAPKRSAQAILAEQLNLLQKYREEVRIQHAQGPESES